jgi:hypothetical protein
MIEAPSGGENRAGRGHVYRVAGNVAIGEASVVETYVSETIGQARMPPAPKAPR